MASSDPPGLLLRDKLRARIRAMGASVDHQRLAADVLGIRGAPPELARRLVSQALVVEDRRHVWRETGERICRDAPPHPGVYILRDDEGRALYVGKAVNLRRRLRAHFSIRRWRATNANLARTVMAEWIEVGSEVEALLREGALIDALEPIVNVQVGRPALVTRAIPAALVHDTIVVAPSVEADSAELIAARADGDWMIQRTRRSGADLAVHGPRLWRFFFGAFRRLGGGPSRSERSHPERLRSEGGTPPLAPIVFSWLARRGASATRLDPRGMIDVRDLRRRLSAVLRDERLFQERLEQY